MKALALPVTFLASAATHAALMFNDVNPPSIPGFGNVDANAIMLDDVAIPRARMNGMTMLDVTRVEVRVFAPQAGTYRVRGWQSTATVQGNSAAPGTPATVGFKDIVATANNQSFNFSFGDGNSVLFRAFPLAVNLAGQPYSLLYFGLSFDAPLSNIGWYTANGPDVNEPTFWKYYGLGDPRNGLTTLGGGQHGSFYIALHGTPVPEPASLLVLGSGLFLASRRRLGRKANR